MNSLRTPVLAGALLITAMANLATSAHASDPRVRGTAFDQPDAIVYSWGVLAPASDTPQIQYFSQDIGRVESGRVDAPSKPANDKPVSSGDLRGTNFDKPTMVTYSWGLLDSPADGPQVQYFWADVNAELSARQAKGQAQLVATAHSAGATDAYVQNTNLRGATFDTAEYTVYSWGVLHSPADGPQVQYFVKK